MSHFGSLESKSQCSDSQEKSTHRSLWTIPLHRRYLGSFEAHWACHIQALPKVHCNCYNRSAFGAMLQLVQSVLLQITKRFCIACWMHFLVHSSNTGSIFKSSLLRKLYSFERPLVSFFYPEFSPLTTLKSVCFPTFIDFCTLTTVSKL